MLRAEKLNVFRGKLHILWDISIYINKDEIVALIGPNGAGKSTLLQSLAGLLYPASGHIFFNNEEITNLPIHKRVELGISFVPEDRRLFPDLTVYENLRVGAYTSRARKKIKDTLEYVFNIFPLLKERRNQLAMTLSGGEQRMLSIARALMSKPEFLILDEISQGLAPKIMTEVSRVLREIREGGTSILIAEQNIEFVLGFSDRAYVLENGRIFAEGESKKILESEYVKKVYLGM